MESVDARRRLAILVAFAAVYLIWGSTYLVIAMAIETVPPFTMAGSRFVLAGIILMAFALLRGLPMPSARQWWGAGVVGTLMLLGGNGLVTWAEQTVPSSVAALLITTVPIWMTVLDRFYGGTRPGLQTWIGIVAGFGGVAVLIGPSDDDLGALPLLGTAALLVAAFSWANGSLLSRRLKLPKEAAVSLGAQTLVAGSLMMLLGAARGEWSDFALGDVSARSAWSMFYLVFLGSMAALGAYQFLLRNVSASAVGTYAFVNPMVAVALGWFVAGEPITPRVLGAGAAILVAVVLILSSRRRARDVAITGAAVPLESGSPALGDGGEGQAHAKA